MRLESTSKKLKKLRNKNWHVAKTLPDVREIVERSMGAPQAGVVSARYGLDAMEIWQESSQQALGGIVQAVGIPAYEVFKVVTEQFKIDPIQDITRKLEQAYGTVDAAIASMSAAGDSELGGPAMATAARGGVGVGVKAMIAAGATALGPVVGLAVGIAWSVAKFTAKIVQLARAGQEYGAVEKIWDPSRFHPWLDNQVLNGTLLDQLRTKTDWTRIFSPPSLGIGQGTQSNNWIKKVPGGGEIFRRLGRGDDGLPIKWAQHGWLGMVPGTATLHAGIRWEGNLVSEVGDSLFPSARGVAGWVWKQLAGRDPLSSVFAVHADAMAAAWDDYIHDLHVFISETDDIGLDDKSRIMKRFNASGGPIFSWGTDITPTANEWDFYQPKLAGDDLRRRQLAACDTLLIAYVDESYAAFQDPVVMTRFKQRRSDLLDHPARCRVVLDSVIEPAYAQQLRDRGVGSVQCARGPQVFSATPADPTPFADTLAPGTGGGGGGWGGLDVPRSRKGSKLLPLAALAALGWAGWHFYGNKR